MLDLPGSAILYHGMWELHAAWGFPRVEDAEVYCQVELVFNAASSESRWRPLCALLGPFAEGERPFAHIESRHDARQLGVPIALHLADALSPPPGAKPAARAVAEVFRELGAQATRKSVRRHATATLAPKRIAAAVHDRMRRVLVGDGAEPEQPPDDIQVECIRRHAHGLSPRCAVTFLRGPLNLWCMWHCMHDTTKDTCLYGCEGQPDSLSHYLRCWPLRLAVALFDAGDPTASATEFFAVGDSSDVTDAVGSFRRLVLATLGYHATRARTGAGYPARQKPQTSRAPRSSARFSRLAGMSRPAGV